MRLLDLKALREVKGVCYSRSQLWRLERAGQFPKRINLGPNRIAWLESEIDAWIAARLKLRDDATDSATSTGERD